MKSITKEQFAVLYAQQSLFWKLANIVNFKGAIGKSNREFSKFVRTQSKLVKGAKDINISGQFSDDEPNESSHYDIDEALIKLYGKENVSCDSESGEFHVDVTSEYKDKVESFLTKKYPNLSFETKINDEPRTFANWSQAEKFCEENNLTVELPEGYVTDDMMLFVNTVQAKQNELARVKKELEDLIGQ
jgi:hypothetical protein